MRLDEPACRRGRGHRFRVVFSGYRLYSRAISEVKQRRFTWLHTIGGLTPLKEHRNAQYSCRVTRTNRDTGTRALSDDLRVLRAMKVDRGRAKQRRTHLLLSDLVPTSSPSPTREGSGTRWKSPPNRCSRRACSLVWRFGGAGGVGGCTERTTAGD